MEFLADVWGLVFGAWRLDGEAFARIHRLPIGTSLALSVVLLAGLSEAIGQSVVLFVNRVKPRRFVVSLLVAAALFAFNFFFWALSIWGVAYLALGPTHFSQVVQAVGLGYAPRLLGFLGLLPFVGLPLGLVFVVWSLLAVLVGVQATFAVPLWQALLLSVLGYATLQAMRTTIGRPFITFSRHLRRRAAGSTSGGDNLITDMRQIHVLIEHDFVFRDPEEPLAS